MHRDKFTYVFKMRDWLRYWLIKKKNLLENIVLCVKPCFQLHVHSTYTMYKALNQDAQGEQQLNCQTEGLVLLINSTTSNILWEKETWEYIYRNWISFYSKYILRKTEALFLMLKDDYTLFEERSLFCWVKQWKS